MLVLNDILEQAENLHGNRVAVSNHGLQLTYSKLLDRSRRLATALRQNHVAPGDRVAILARNSFRYLEVNFACVMVGAILVPLNVRLAKPEIDAIISRTECGLAFCADPFHIENVPNIGWDDALGPGEACAYETLLIGAQPDQQRLQPDPSEIAQIFFTSGTTGLPKGVCLSHENLLASALDSVETLELGSSDAWLHAAPMFHLVDAFAIWGMTVAGGRHVTTHFEPDLFGPLVEEARITKTSLPPTLLDWISRARPRLRHDLSSLALISYGGSPMQEAVYRRCHEALRCRILQAYGLTEGSGFVCHEIMADNPDPDTPMNTVGRPTRRVMMELRRDDGHPTPGGEVGEVVISGTRVFKAYWRDPVTTRDAFTGSWYRTGDLAVMDPQGRYRIVGRKKEMIITGGENVYPGEVVNALLAHPAIAEAAVFGLPSERWGEEVQAVVYIVPDCPVVPASEELARHCRNLIGGYKSPKRIEIWTLPLPKTGAGKIATALIRETFLNRQAS
jgi:acyl-CoA synthetase (AMP-forming)/AMP-acid ligase II